MHYIVYYKTFTLYVVKQRRKSFLCCQCNTMQHKCKHNTWKLKRQTWWYMTRHACQRDLWLLYLTLKQYRAGKMPLSQRSDSRITGTYKFWIVLKPVSISKVWILIWAISLLNPQCNSEYTPYSVLKWTYLIPLYTRNKNILLWTKKWTILKYDMLWDSSYISFLMFFTAHV